MIIYFLLRKFQIYLATKNLNKKDLILLFSLKKSTNLHNAITFSLPFFPTTHEQNMAKRNQPFNPKDMHLLKYGVEGDEPVIMTG